jgi:hypothetical protein
MCYDVLFVRFQMRTLAFQKEHTMIVITVPAWFAVAVALGVVGGIYEGVKDNIENAKKMKNKKKNEKASRV